jgi:DNA replication regulator SLD2
MEAQEREELTERSNSLRVELKIWEKSFAAANNGKKASRDDIKKHPDIGKISRFGMLESLVLKVS